VKTSVPTYDALLEAKERQVRLGLSVFRLAMLNPDAFEVEKAAFESHMRQQAYTMASAAHQAIYVNVIVRDYMRDVIRPKYLGGQPRQQQKGMEK